MGALWGGLSGAKSAAAQGQREAPPGRYPVARFRRAASWLQTLLRPPAGVGLLPLEQVIRTNLTPLDPNTARIHFDASPWGGGAVLFRQGQPSEFMMTTWSRSTAATLGEVVGQPGGQTTWEYLTLYLSLLLWGSTFSATGLVIFGDNTGALSNAVSLKGKGSLARISREIAWRKVRYAWRFGVSHLPSEANTLADALSRVAAPAGSEKKQFPPELADVTRRGAPDPDSWWQVG